MASDTLTIDQFVTSNRITITCNRVDRNPNMEDSHRMDNWKCLLVRTFETETLYTDKTGESKPRTYTARMTVHFSKGFGLKGAEPTAAEVLDCLASDAAGIENARSFEDWCSEYGYDTDSRRAEKTFKTCEHQASRLKTFLGDELFETLLWKLER
jgi:hypothetical protein